MTRVGSFDGEIGRGRQRDGNDSSSSRESSPVRTRPKRSFSPVLSDDDNTAIEPTGDKDDTPPPTERPLLRASLAFSVAPPPQAAISTYEPTVAPQPKKGFLPGQEVIMPPKPKATSKRNKTGVKRPRRPDAYPGQTSRFRLETYDPTPSADPPIAHGNGPYSSMYRGVVAMAGQEGQTSAEPRQLSSLPASESSSPNGIHLSLPNTGELLTMDGRTVPGGVPLPKNNVSSNPSLGPVPPHVPPAQNLLGQPQRPQISTATGRLISSASTTPVEQHIPVSQTFPPQSSLPTPTASTGITTGHATYVTDTTLTIRERTSPGPHYRRDYDNREMTPPKESMRSSTTANSKASASDSQAQKKTRGPLRIVTLLIEDVRSDEPDPQLAEVKVPLKRSDDEDDGWWADAKDIAEQLQSGPSRIDGPARAFTMRGKYRQFILRVTSENKDEFVSANVAISPQKTLDVTVELLHPPGAAPRPRPVPRNSWSRHDEDHRPDDYMETDSARPGSSSRKRGNSPSFDEYDMYSRRSHSQGGPNKMARHDRWERSPRMAEAHSYARNFYSRKSSAEPESWRGQHPSPPPRDRERTRHQPPPSYSPGYHRPSSPTLPAIQTSLPSPTLHRPHQMTTPTAYPRHEEDEDAYAPADEPFIRAVDRLLREHPNLCDEYFRASAGCRVSDLVRQYEIVAKMIKRFAGRQPPGFHQIVDENHIARALEIEDPETFLSKYHETMSLLQLYGKNGRVHEDPRVLQMIEDRHPPGPGFDPARKLLRQLRAADDAWTNDRIGPMLDGINPPGPDPYDRPGPYAPEATHLATQKTDIRPPSLSLSSPTSRQHSFRDTQALPHSLSTLPAPPHSGSADSNASSDAPRYTSRGKGLFVD